MKQIFDPSKPVQTRDGCPARIVCRDALGCGDKPILALVKRGNREVNIRYHTDGRVNFDVSCNSDNDLVNMPEQVKTTIWVNVYPDGSSLGHSSLFSADTGARAQRLACVQVDITVGEPFGYAYTLTKQP